MLHGFLNIDKPAGITSHDVVAHIRRAARQKRVGHAGTLDPAATGVLVVALGNATRLIEYVQDATSKRYLATVQLGTTTATDDAEGAVLTSSADKTFNVASGRILMVVAPRMCGKDAEIRASGPGLMPRQVLRR